MKRHLNPGAVFRCIHVERGASQNTPHSQVDDNYAAALQKPLENLTSGRQEGLHYVLFTFLFGQPRTSLENLEGWPTFCF